jgi:methionyl-tRNA formyltransferase
MTTKIILLLSKTVRSVAYVQALNNARIQVAEVVLYGDEQQADIHSERSTNPPASDIFCPDISLDLDSSLSETNWPLSRCKPKELDNAELICVVENLSADLIVYSGYPGQIVPKTLLDVAPVIHIHSGWLPDFPGSTTIYYQILQQQRCGASAILLNETIDSGPILTTKHYPLPAPLTDIDYLYDNMIRADLLVEVLANIDKYFDSKKKSSQNEQILPYYIIHPLLKNIAILSSDNSVGEEGHCFD